MEEKYKIHSVYILFILVSIIICLVSVEWSEIPGLADYITFALTLSSLILAVLAIVYSIHSNSSISISLNDMSRSATEVTKASIDLHKSNDELRSELLKFPDALSDVGKHVAETNIILEEMYRGKDEGVSEQLTTDAELPESMTEKFLSSSSITGLFVLLAVSLSNKNNTSFLFEDLFKDSKGKEDRYSFSYFICSSAIGLFNYSSDAQGRYNILSVNNYFADNVESSLKSKIVATSKNMYEDDVDENERVKQEWLDEVKSIKEYFGEAPTITKE